MNTNDTALRLKSCLTASDLTFLGIGAIIGAGIFVLTGIVAATQAGPAIVISFLIAGLACAFAALSYAELATTIGGCGSAYGYAHAGLGVFVAWVIGWDLILEYAIAVPTVAIGWSGYVQDTLIGVGLHLPNSLMKGPFQGGVMNLPAVIIILFATVLLILGAKVSSQFNKVMVGIKLTVIGLFILIASQHISSSNFHPFVPFGWTGIMSGAALIFFAYIGFDAVSTTAEEVINPARDLPIGILGSLAVCTLLYILVAGLLTGIIPYHLLNVSSPISEALIQLGYTTAASTIAVGAIAGLTTVILVMFFGLTRVFLAMSRDGLLPPFFADVNATTRTPVRIIIVSGLVMAMIAGIVPMNDLAELVNIGTLSAFAIVCLGVIVLRVTRPDAPRPFKTPFSPLVPSLGILFCLYLMFSLPLITWIRFFVWFLVGFALYMSYGKGRAKHV